MRLLSREDVEKVAGGTTNLGGVYVTANAPPADWVAGYNPGYDETGGYGSTGGSVNYSSGSLHGAFPAMPEATLDAAVQAVQQYGQYKLPAGVQVRGVNEFAYVNPTNNVHLYSDTEIAPPAGFQEINGETQYGVVYVYAGAMESWNNVEYDVSNPAIPNNIGETTATLTPMEAMIHTIEHEAYHDNGHPGAGVGGINEAVANYWGDQAVIAYRAAGH